MLRRRLIILDNCRQKTAVVFKPEMLADGGSDFFDIFFIICYTIKNKPKMKGSLRGISGDYKYINIAAKKTGRKDL